jgi:hypothetical protein
MANGLSYRNYGWGLPPLNGAFNESDHAFDASLGTHPELDQRHADEWLREFKDYEASGEMPALETIWTLGDHTLGTLPGAPTPKAMVADNDLAVGRIVDAVTHSPFWATTAIFVVEDDAQDGPDHIDAHRTVAQVISPYTQHGTIDSHFYSTVSMLRTMELILGVEPLTQQDSAATPMFASFSDSPDATTFDAITPQQPLDELNTIGSPLAAASATMDFSGVDRAPHRLLNEAIWRSVKGVGSRMPAPKTTRAARHR